jgi:hypothetical protein
MNIFTKHSNSHGKTYWQHFKFAGKVSIMMFASSLFFFIHAVFPFISIPKKLNFDAIIQRVVAWLYETNTKR